MHMILMLVIAAGGYDAFPHLSFGVGARELAMGGAGTASCNSAAACFWNPAALARLGTGSVTAFLNPSPLGSQLRTDGDGDGFIAWGMPLSGDVSIGAAADRLSLGGIACRQTETWSCDTAAYYETMGTLCTGVRLFGPLNVGGGLVFYSRALGDKSADTPVSDFGLGVALGLECELPSHYRIGVSARSGTQGLANGDRLAPRVAVGFSGEPMPRLLVSVDVSQRMWRAYIAGFGAEYWLVPVSFRDGVSIAARAGVKDIPFGQFTPPTAVTAGLGFGFKSAQFRVGLDYAIVHQWSFGGMHHLLSLTVGY